MQDGDGLCDPVFTVFLSRCRGGKQWNAVCADDDDMAHAVGRGSVVGRGKVGRIAKLGLSHEILYVKFHKQCPIP
jgi:hypothetical protein